MNESGVGQILDLIARLRGDKGCPWDKKQTPESMGKYLLEETFELIDAIKKDDAGEVCEESGDVLFQLLFIIKLFSEKGQFSINDVISQSIDKMIRRHPHVFGDAEADTVEDVKRRWDQIKSEEKEESCLEENSLLDSIPTSMPALMRAHKISDRVGRAGFDWNDIDGVFGKAFEEWGEFRNALKANDRKNTSLEFGDVLFTLVNVARFAGINPEEALRDSTNKFEKRYRYLEKSLKNKGAKPENASREELDNLWDEAKKVCD